MLFRTWLVVVALAAPGLRAQDTAEIRAALVNRVEEARRAAGIVVGTLGPQGRSIVASGKVSLEGGAAPDENTVFEIGSVTKLFTSLVLADMIERGEVKPGDPVGKYLPDTVKMPRFETREITLLDISMQLSGLPRMPSNFAPADPANPYADYDEQKLFEFLSGYLLERPPGEKYEYSNLAVGLLGHALARRAGKPYEELVRERVLAPLGMTSTSIQLSPDQRRRFAPGYNRGLDPVKNWDMGVLAGAGALHSTTADMLKFLAAAMGAVKTPLAPAFQRMLTVRKGTGGQGVEIAMGWHIFKRYGSEIVWHNGGTAGYHSFAGYDPEKKTAVVVLANTDLTIDDIGLHFLNAQYPSPKLAPGRKEIALDEKTLERYTGQYALGPEAVFVITREGASLYAQLAKQPRLRLYAEKEGEFFYKMVDAQISFVADAAGKVTHLVLHQGGRDLKADRK
jgi:CubicO group peptidase (beta-lactamase class C family)